MKNLSLKLLVQELVHLVVYPPYIAVMQCREKCKKGKKAEAGEHATPVVALFMAGDTQMVDTQAEEAHLVEKDSTNKVRTV